MSAYVVNPLDPASPLDSNDVKQAAEEFRKLKTRINALDPAKANRAYIGGIEYPITAGAANSGGAGFRVLLVPN